MNPKEAIDKGIRLVVGVDQTPFDALANQFCLAYPLFVEENGDDLSVKQFGNRGRLWWKTDNVPQDQLIPGTLHVVSIENSIQAIGDDPDKDRFQVQLGNRSSSTEHWFEIISVDEPMPTVDELAHRGLPCETRPFPLAVVQFKDRVVGPMRTDWTLSDQTVRLMAADLDRSLMRSRPSSDLEGAKGVKKVRWAAGEFDKNSSSGAFEVSRRLFSATGATEFLEAGEQIDAVPLDEVARIFQERLRNSSYKRKIHDDPINRIEALLPEGDELEWNRFERFRAAFEAKLKGLPEAAEFSSQLLSRLTGFMPPLDEAPAVTPDPAPKLQKAAGGASKPAEKNEPVEVPDPAVWSEAGFLQHLIQGVQAAGYHFEEADLVAFHMALKASPMVVLAGRSGVGKSSLPRLYARSMGASDDLLHVAVRPDWMDDRDVVGAYDPLSQRFLPAATELVDFLRESSRLEAAGDGRLRIVVLDEMNLARVEYYFASFLSALEQPSESRYIRVFSPSVAQEDDPYLDCARLRIPDNVRFVGTVNIDETTHFLSPKVLDRVCLQTFAPPRLRESTQELDESRVDPVTPVAWSEWKAWKGDRGVVEGFVTRTLHELHSKLELIRSGLGHRTQHRCLDFVAGATGPNRPMQAMAALDLALLQLVLPRIRADHQDFPDVAPQLIELLPEENYPRSNRLLKELRDGGGTLDFWQLA